MKRLPTAAAQLKVYSKALKTQQKGNKDVGKLQSGYMIEKAQNKFILPKNISFISIALAEF